MHFENCSNFFSDLIFLDDAVRHMVCQPPGLPVLAGLVNADEILLPDVYEAISFAKRTELSICSPGALIGLVKSSFPLPQKKIVIVQKTFPLTNKLFKIIRIDLTFHYVSLSLVITCP